MYQEKLKIDWVSHILGRLFNVFLCFTLYLRTISKYKPSGGLYLEGRFNRGFFGLRVWGLIYGGAYFLNSTVGLEFCSVSEKIYFRKYRREPSPNP